MILSLKIIKENVNIEELMKFLFINIVERMKIFLLIILIKIDLYSLTLIKVLYI